MPSREAKVGFCKWVTKSCWEDRGRTPRTLFPDLVSLSPRNIIYVLSACRNCTVAGRCDGLSGNQAEVLLYQTQPPNLCSQRGPPASCTMQGLHNSHLSNLESCFKSKVSQLHSWFPASCIALGSNCQRLQKKPGQLQEFEKTIITSKELPLWNRGC